MMLGILPYIVYGSLTETLKCCSLISAGIALLLIDLMARFGVHIVHVPHASPMPAVYRCLVLILLVLPASALPGRLAARGGS